MSKLRDFVLEMFETGEEYSRNDVVKYTSKTFGEGSYSDKQIQNLLYNLTKLNKIERTNNRRYRRAKKESSNEKDQTSNDTFTLEQYICQIRRMCISVNNELNKKDFLERYKGADLNSLNQIYCINKKILRDISDCEKKMNSETMRKLSFEK